MTAADPAPAPVAGTRRAVAGWMLFDWAAQPFFTVVTTFVFGPYFVAHVAADPVSGQAMWGYAAAAAGLVIAILSPVLGSVADAAGARKPWLLAFAALKLPALVALWWAEPGSAAMWPLLCFSIATIAAEFSIVFNDSMMPRLFTVERMGRISNLAWGLGYLGGMLALIGVLGFLAGSPETGLTLLGLEPLFGLDPAQHEGARIAGPLAAVWYAVFLLPLLLFTPDAAPKKPIGQAVTAGLSDLASTLRELRQRRGLLRFLLARMIYQDGLTALLLLGGTFAAAMFGWQTIEIGLYGIILNVTAIIGNLAAGPLDDRAGSKTVVMLALAILIVAALGIVSTGPDFAAFRLVGLAMEDTGGLYGTAAEKLFIVFGLLIGIAFGPVQASSRAYLARSVVQQESGRYFGLYALAGRATSFLAPFLVATVTALSGSTRLGMAMILIFLVVGMVLLAATPYPASRKAQPEQ